MKVLVIGGTRGTGREVVIAAHAAGHELTLLARNAERISLPVTGVRVVAGDARDADDIERAVAGQASRRLVSGHRADEKTGRRFFPQHAVPAGGHEQARRAAVDL